MTFGENEDNNQKTTGGGCMYKALVAFCLVGLFAGFHGSALGKDEQPPLRVAVDAPYPPFAMLDKRGNLSGFDVDIANALCAELKRTCVIKAVPFDDIIPAIVAGDIDIGIAGMGPSEERRKLVDFTDKYFRSLSIYIEKKGSALSVTPAGLKGLRIGVQSGTMQDGYLKKHFNATSTIISVENHEDVLSMLSKGELDLALVDGLAGYAYLKTPAGEGLETAGGPLETDDIMNASCIAVSKKQPELREAINMAIQAIRRSGEYGKINRRYFDFNIY